MFNGHFVWYTDFRGTKELKCPLYKSMSFITDKLFGFVQRTFGVLTVDNLQLTVYSRQLTVNSLQLTYYS